MEVFVEENFGQRQGPGDQASCQGPQHGDTPPLPSELTSNLGNLSYWPTLDAELIKCIPQVHGETPPKEDKLAYRVAWCDPKVYDRNYDPVVVEEWVKGMEKIFTVVKVPEEKKVNIGTYYSSGEANIWWNTIKGGHVGPEFIGVNS